MVAGKLEIAGADLLGLHIGTAAKWAEHANAAHTRYAATQAAHPAERCSRSDPGPTAQNR